MYSLFSTSLPNPSRRVLRLAKFLVEVLGKGLRLIDLDYPSQKMFHPLPPSLGPGVYLAVERATSFIADDLWYGIFAGINPDLEGFRFMKHTMLKENWTSGVDLGRLLDLLELDLITTNGGLQAAVQDQRSASAAGIDSTVAESSSLLQVPSKDKIENFEHIKLNIQQVEGEPQQGHVIPTDHVYKVSTCW
ncbi:hypothetical protein V6N12_065974 [Hibiscus sabdariffa]|uniref:Nal1 C-terminal domain-containing protein n=1 Tax=Hibiscus sabdariffa TaxID=183260 RepID=A0ABR2AN19_9ROSI